MHIPSLVGHTSSHKPIYQYYAADNYDLSEMAANFTEHDRFDALAVFSFLELVYWRRYGAESREYISCQMMLKLLEQNLSNEFLRRNKATLAIITVIDLSNYGRKHCAAYLQELVDT